MEIGDKEIMTLEQAAQFYLQCKIEETKTDVINFFDELEDSYSEKFKVNNYSLASIEFMIARCAIDCKSLQTLYPQQIANRIFTLVLKKVKFDELSEKEIANKIFGYMEILDDFNNSKTKAVKNRQLERFSESFLKSILGSNIENFYLKGFSRKNIISPLLLAHCNNLLFNYKVSWRKLKDKVALDIR